MAFKTDGSVHHEGIKEEKNIKKDRRLLTEAFNLSPKAKIHHRGGTQFKADIEIEDKGKTTKISIKKKKKLGSGSFDYINSSAALENSIFDNVKSEAKRIKKSKSSVATERKNFNTTCNKAMKDMSTEILKGILTKHVLNANADMEMLVTETSTKAVYTFSFADTPLAKSIKNHTPKFKWGRGKTSAKIIFEDSEGNIHDHGIRGRLVSNNGITAMMGKSKTNKHSQPVFKIQQDGVSKMIKELIDKNIAKKWR